MGRPKKIVEIEILNFETYRKDFKFKDSESYLKISFRFQDLYLDLGLNHSEYFLLERLILMSFVQRCPKIVLNLHQFCTKYALNKHHFSTLISSNIISLSAYKERDNNIKQDKEASGLKKKGVDTGLEACPPQDQKTILVCEDFINNSLKRISATLK